MVPNYWPDPKTGIGYQVQVELPYQVMDSLERIETVQLPTRWGTFTLHAYQSVIDREPHLALCKGGIGDLGPDGKAIVHEEPVLVRGKILWLLDHPAERERMFMWKNRSA